MNKYSVTTVVNLAVICMTFSALMISAPAESAPINVQILSATIKDQKIGGATVTLQKNGEQSAVSVSSPQGQV